MNTRYARLGSAHIAYQRHGQGRRDVIFLLGLSTHVEAAWDEPGLVRYLERAVGTSRITCARRHSSSSTAPITSCGSALPSTASWTASNGS